MINTPYHEQFHEITEFGVRKKNVCNWLLQASVSRLQHTLGGVITGIHPTSLREAEPTWEKMYVHTINRNLNEECWRDRSKFSLAGSGWLSFNK